MAGCDPQLSQAEREAAFDQQRTGVVRALRPFSGTATVENLVDYINREMGPVLRQTRAAANDVWKQVVDNAPSANPLSYYFSDSVAAADPTAGRIRLNQATQNTATIIRVSENNGRLQSIQPWLDVMSGGPTTPLGTVTLLDAINPGRFLRFDLNTMTDQGAYWDLGVTFIEGSDTNPFTDGEAVTIGFIAGVSAAGSTVPVTALTPIANDTFVGNVSGATAAPAAVNLSALAGAGLAFGTHTLDVTGSTSITIASDQVQRAALTGAITASLNSNTTAFGTAAAKSVLANATNATAVPAFLAGSAAFQHLRVNSANNALEWATLSGYASTSITYTSDTFQRAALTGEVTASANSNATTVTRSTDFQASPWTGNHQFNGELRLGTLQTVSSIGSINVTTNAGVTRILFSGTGTITVGTISGCAEGRVIIVEFTGTGTHTLTHDATSADAIGCPGNNDLIINGRGGAVLVGRGTSTFGWKVIAMGTDLLSAANTWTATNTFSGNISMGQKVLFAGIISPTALSADQNDYNPTGWTTSNFVRLSTNDATTRVLTGAQAGSSGELKWLVNLGPGSVQLNAGSTSSSASNRWLVASGTTFTIASNGVCGILYDGTSSRWRAIYPAVLT